MFRSYERPRLNERFLYLIFFSVYTGILQGVYHVTKDRARLEFPETPVNHPPMPRAPARSPVANNVV